MTGPSTEALMEIFGTTAANKQTINKWKLRWISNAKINVLTYTSALNICAKINIDPLFFQFWYNDSSPAIVFFKHEHEVMFKLCI